MQVASITNESATVTFSKMELVFINNAFVYAMDDDFSFIVQWSRKKIEDFFEGIRQGFVD